MSNETKQEHTAGEWIAWEFGGLYSIYDSTGRTNLLDAEQCSDAPINAQRIIACVNAMEGIEDPEGFMKDARIINDLPPGYYVASITTKDNIVELQKYKTACESINKDNPMAVAESLQEMYNLLQKAGPMFDDAKSLHVRNAVHQEFLEEDRELIKRLAELLTKIQSK